ncbi:MAG: outer membrane beta-barrel protein, partial [Cyclobacteriaceae bacterium]|nr:outer membrane beta-barrel protein [Cyclobacteriaceae bacterium]
MRLPVRSLPLLCLLFLTTSAFGQKFSIRGKVVDTLSNPISSATVLLLQRSDSALVNFTVTNARGEFELKNVSGGPFRLRITFVGLAPVEESIQPAQGTLSVDLGTLTMQPMTRELEALVVEGEKAPVTVKRDTIEFNAGSFKTRANATVEDLLKKMPGIQVESDGTIRAQGEQVQRVMVDGKEFFGRDPKLATRNLPADAVNKVQVFDKKSDQAQFTGIDDGQKEKAINLELKEEKRNGMFGSVMAGAGTNDRLESRGNLNRFSKNRQLSVLGMGNNTNQQGFSVDDYMNFTGGSTQMMRGGAVRLEFSDDNTGGVPLNFGGRQNGIMTNIAGGVNMNETFSRKTQVNGSYFYSHLDQSVNRKLNRLNYLAADSTYTQDQQSAQRGTSDSHRLNFTLDHKIDTANSVKVTANAGKSLNTNKVISQTTTTTDEGVVLNTSDRNTYTSADGRNATANAIYRHRFEKKGRSFSLNANTTLSTTTTDGQLLSSNNFLVTQEKRDVQQTNHQQSDGSLYGVTATYIEPLGNRKYLEASYSHRTDRNAVVRDVFNEQSGQLTRDTLLSNLYHSNYTYMRPGLMFRLNRKKFSFTAGANWQRTFLKGRLDLRQIDINRTFENVLPVVRFNYDFSNFKHLRIDYETSMQEPGIQQLQPVVDNSDPINIVKGNPGLKPSYTHRLQVNNTLFNPGSFISFFTFLSATYATNFITSSQSIDDRLVRTTQPVNVKDNLQLNADMSFGFPIRPIKSRVSVGPTVRYTKGINVVNNQESGIVQQTLGGSVRYDFTIEDIFFLGLSSSLSEQQTAYAFNAQRNQSILTGNYGAEGNLTVSKKYQLNADFNYYDYRSRTTGFSQAIPILNVSVSRFILKNNAGEIKLSVMNALD